ncbi:MAG: hypothetical protein H7345_06565 [Rubritepida sp.]|nr:hypothetical protein [Rubritepida sp.]
MPGAMPPAPTGDTSASGQLTGLLAQNSPYLQQARAGGVRTAARRGLLNSSIAAGSGEAAAIAAAAPIASQDAQQLAQTAQTRLEGDINFNNSSRLQTQQTAGQMDLQRLSDTGAMSRQTAAAADELHRLGITISAQANTATADHANQMTLAQIQSNHSLVSSYLAAFGEMSKNADLPAAARNAYVQEMQTVISQSMALTTQLASRQIAWGT